MDGYHAHYNLGKGFGGVAILSKVKPINVTFDLPDSDFDDAKRLITAEFEKFFLVSTYVVNSGKKMLLKCRRNHSNISFYRSRFENIRSTFEME